MSEPRTIVLYPGESVTIGDTTIKAEIRGAQFMGAPVATQDDECKTTPTHPVTPTPIPAPWLKKPCLGEDTAKFIPLCLGGK